ncbi:MAG: organic hydroperoxide resistance protein [Rhodanobacter sp.]
MPINVKYATSAVATGGREGRTRSLDGTLELDLSTPRELGGDGGAGTNPEQLFAAGYAACFLSALKFAAQQNRLSVPDDAAVTATVGIGMREEGGFGLEVDIAIALPGLTKEDSLRLAEAAHQACPYSNATRNNIDVTVTVI